MSIIIKTVDKNTNKVLSIKDCTAEGRQIAEQRFMFAIQLLAGTDMKAVLEEIK